MTELSKSEITSAAEFAHYYRGLGLQAVPARMPSEGVDWKRPALSTWKEHSGALVDDTIFTVWYGLNGKHLNRPNLGLITGSASGRVFVLDADTHKHPDAQHWLDGVLALHNNGAMFETPTQRTGGGGFQYLFRAPPDWSPPTCKTPIGIDVRGEGGFAMLPPSIHETGEHYAWMSGKEPWEVAIMDAPQWLCDEIDKLLTKSSGKSTKELSTSGDNKESHKHVKNASGKLTDGREDYMKSLIWARIVALYRESPIRPVTEILKAECQKAFDVYLQKVTTNIEEAGTPIKSLLERENRGWTEFELKWVYAMDQWDSDVAMAVKNEQPPECPRPLMRELPSPEPFPVDAMGELLGSAAKAIHDKVQAALAICCQSVLANATLCIQGHADVLLPMGHARPLSCYFVTVAATGERKSASDHESCGATKKHEMNLRDKRELDMPGYINRHEAWDAAKRKAKGKGGISDLAGIKSALDKVGPEPEAPLEPLLTCPEPTYEGLCKLLAIGQPSMGVMASEGGQFIGGYAMNDENKLKTACGLSEVWDGTPIRRVRSGDGTLYLPGRRVSLHLQVQPGVGDILFGDATLADQGLLSRVLVSAPASTAGTRFQREEKPETAQALKRYNARMLEILQTPLPLAEGKRNELQPRCLAMSAHATNVWRNYADHLESQLGPNGEMDAIRGLANKLPEHAARLAGVLTLVENIDASSITADHMRSGIALADHYAAEALRLFGANKVNADLKLAQRLLDHLHANWTEPAVSLPDIYQRTLNAIGDKATAARMARILEDHGWLREITGGAIINGERRRDAWTIVRKA